MKKIILSLALMTSVQADLGDLFKTVDIVPILKEGSSYLVLPSNTVKVIREGIRTSKSKKLAKLDQKCIEDSLDFADKYECYTTGLKEIDYKVKKNLKNTKKIISSMCLSANFVVDQGTCFRESVAASNSVELKGLTSDCLSVLAPKEHVACFTNNLK